MSDHLANIFNMDDSSRQLVETEIQLNDVISTELSDDDQLLEVERELDIISEKAMSAAEDLLDLSMNVETKYTAGIADVANKFLNTKMSAKLAKIEKRMEMQELKLKQQKNQIESLKKPKQVLGDNAQNADVVVTSCDRNALLD
jgi:hypothetical protein